MQNHAQLLAILNRSQIFAWEINTNSGIVTYSDNVKQIMGFLPGNDSKLTIHLIHPDDVQALALAYRDAIASNSKFECTYRFINPDTREEIWLYSEGVVFQNNSDILISGVSEKISGPQQNVEWGAAKAAQNLMHRTRQLETLNERLLKSEKELNLALEAAQLATWSWNLLTNEVKWNRQHFLLLGLEFEPRMVKPEEFFNRVHPEDRGYVHARLTAGSAGKALRDLAPTPPRPYRGIHRRGHCRSNHRTYHA